MIDAKTMLELIKDEPEDAYIPIVKPELVALCKAKLKSERSIELYHFCAAMDVESIKSQGLTLGMCPVVTRNGIKLITQCQWLTKDMRPEAQSWATSHNLSYSRTAYRLKVVIPGKHVKKLIAATEFVKKLPKEARHVVDGWPGSENWYIYRGKILPQWIKEIVKVEGEGNEQI